MGGQGLTGELADCFQRVAQLTHRHHESTNFAHDVAYDGDLLADVLTPEYLLMPSFGAGKLLFVKFFGLVKTFAVMLFEASNVKSMLPVILCDRASSVGPGDSRLA
ncbi:hypothetical protein A5782_08470 [Mycobacterium sp. 852002-40037_SCH5390672]|nr:hypothetical protein A5782_08470 [Mycobacterium sp. 852002-40037_SCH5390672]